MAANRYGRIYHSEHHYINLRFQSVDARNDFIEKFEQFHAGHDHDGDPPRFEETLASTIGNPESTTIHDAHSVSIDGYATYEIEAYHNPDRWNTYNSGRYRPPTCCVAPLISIDRTFIDSATLTRHELSEIFMDMPETDFENLLKSVETEGFKDPIIRMLGDQVLDGWHRYRAARQLNLIRKLRFQQWNEKDEGDPEAFAYARNMHRRHHPKSVRAQIAVSFNERFGHGGDRTETSHQNDDLKTRQEIAKEAGVSTATIDRAITIEKAGRADEVIAGETSAGKVITEITVEELLKQLSAEMKDWKQRHTGVSYASKSVLIAAYREQMESEQEGAATAEELKGILKLMRQDSKAYALRVRYSQSDERNAFETAQTDYFKARADFTAKIAEKEIELSAFIEAAKLQYHRTNIADMFREPGEIRRDDTLTANIFEDWTGFLRVLSVDVNASAPWVPVAAASANPQRSDSEQPSQTSEERSEVSHHDDRDRTTSRETNKLLKRKKQIAKNLWDTRIEAARNWRGDGDTELNQHVTLAELEKAFAANNSSYALNFNLALKLTSQPSFQIMWDKIVEADVPLDGLDVRNRAMQTYAADINQWKRPDWSPDTNWILPLIEAKKKAAENDAETEQAAETPPDTSEPPQPDKKGCQAHIGRLIRVDYSCLDLEGVKRSLDYKQLRAVFNVSRSEAKKLADEVYWDAIKTLCRQHTQHRDAISNFWLDNTNLTEKMDLLAMRAELIEIYDFRENIFDQQFSELTYNEIETEAVALQEIFEELTQPESTLLKKVLGEPTALRIIGIMVEFIDDDADDGEVYQCYFQDDGDGHVRIEQLDDVAITELERFGRYAEPFEDSEK